MHLPQNILNGIIGFGVFVGVVQCFFGYRIFKLILGLTGFLLGGAMAVAISYASSQNEAVALLAGLVGGCIGAALLVAVYFLGIFCMGACLGAVLGAVLFAGAGNDPQPAVLLICAGIGGGLALIFQKFMIIFSTGFGGAWSVVAGLAYFISGEIDPTRVGNFFHATATPDYTMLACWLALGMVGVIVQYKSAPVWAAQPRGSPGGGS